MDLLRRIQSSQVLQAGLGPTQGPQMAQLWRIFWLFTEFSWSIATKGHQVDTLELFPIESDLLFIVWFGRYGHVAATPPERIGALEG